MIIPIAIYTDDEVNVALLNLLYHCEFSVLLSEFVLLTELNVSLSSPLTASLFYRKVMASASQSL